MTSGGPLRALRSIAVTLGLAAVTLLSPHAAAQDGRSGDGSGATRAAAQADVAAAMQRFFENRVRSELGLTDEQMAHILPRVRRLETLRASAREERQVIVRKLQRGMREGADDAALLRGLEGLEGLEEDLRRGEKAVQAEIDSVLTARQRVQFRFFTQRFRAELQRRIRELQGPQGSQRKGRPSRRP